jgi:hypothetical protein
MALVSNTLSLSHYLVSNGESSLLIHILLGRFLATNLENYKRSILTENKHSFGHLVI